MDINTDTGMDMGVSDKMDVRVLIRVELQAQSTDTTLLPDGREVLTACAFHYDF